VECDGTAITRVKLHYAREEVASTMVEGNMVWMGGYAVFVKSDEDVNGSFGCLARGCAVDLGSERMGKEARNELGVPRCCDTIW
jgi:hypothetical protein